MEVSLSFDNAVVNARVVERLSPFWRTMFLMVGVLIAVVGMRLLMPLVLVMATTGLNLPDVITLAFAQGDPEQPGTYGHFIHDAHPQIAAFGGMFMGPLALQFFFTTRENMWVRVIERPLARLGVLDVNMRGALVYLIAASTLVFASFWAPEQSSFLIAGAAGAATYFLVNRAGAFFETDDEDDPDEVRPGIHGTSAELVTSLGSKTSGPSNTTGLVGRAAFFSFLYLEVLDASFSFDGVVGAFAITSNPIFIAIGLGVIGSWWVRSLTIFMVDAGTLGTFEYLEHGAHYAIAVLATILLSVGVQVPEWITGLLGAAFIVAAIYTSVRARHREPTPRIDAQ